MLASVTINFVLIIVIFANLLIQIAENMTGIADRVKVIM